MQINDDDLSNAIILEEIKDQNKAILESLQPIPQIAADLSQLKGDVSDLKNDMKAVKAVIKHHETRITTLETT